MEFLHARGKMDADLMKSPQVVRFVNETAGTLNRAVDEGIEKSKPTDIMVDRLKYSNFVFSGFKVFHEMNEAFPFLLDENGERKPFERFLNEVRSVHEKYNGWYLKAEYDFAVASAQMAAKWERFAAMGDRYDLQYRTADDERVRDSHARLHNVTLPVESPFWEEYFPPNGWGCRCTVVQVRKGKYPVSDERQAMADGNQSTAGKHQEMFRFNPGKKRACFPAYNPYTISACGYCTKSGFLLAAKIPDNEMCRACKVIREMEQEWRRKMEMPRKEADKRVREWMKLHEDGRVVKVPNLYTGELRLNHNAVKRHLGHAFNQEGKWLLTTFADNAGAFRFNDYEVLGERKDMSNPKDVKNVAAKQRRGVIGYATYEYVAMGKTWLVGFEVVQQGEQRFEQPYYIARKRP